jgi:hypothetical protein
MSLTFNTPNPTQLLSAFKNAIDNHKAGRVGQRIDTWDYTVVDGKYYFTHTSSNWGRKAYLRADIELGQLAFYVQQAQGVPLKRDVYGYFAGHLTETFIRHFPSMFSLAKTTPTAVGADAYLSAA